MKNIIFFTSIILVILTGCRVYNNIYSDYDRSVDFTKYKTFAWLPDKDSSNTPYNNQIIRNNTINYFTHCLGERGMYADIDKPDLLLQLVVISEKKEITVTSPTYYGYPNHYNCNPFYYPYPNPYYYHSLSYSNYYNYNQGAITKKIEYTQSTLTLNVIDRVENKLVWMGSAEGDLYDPSYIKNNLHPTVYDILNELPIKLVGKHKRPKN